MLSYFLSFGERHPRWVGERVFVIGGGRGEDTSAAHGGDVSLAVAYQMVECVVEHGITGAKARVIAGVFAEVIGEFAVVVVAFVRVEIPDNTEAKGRGLTCPGQCSQQAIFAKVTNIADVSVLHGRIVQGPRGPGPGWPWRRLRRLGWLDAGRPTSAHGEDAGIGTQPPSHASR